MKDQGLAYSAPRLRPEVAGRILRGAVPPGKREAEKEKAPRLLKRAGLGLWLGRRSGGAGLF